MAPLLASIAVDDLAGRWLAMLLDATIKGTVILVLAGVTLRVMRRAPAAARQLVLLLALVSLLIMPIVSAALPAWQVLPHWAKFEAAPAAPAAPATPTARVEVAAISPPAQQTDTPAAANVPPAPGTRVPPVPGVDLPPAGDPPEHSGPSSADLPPAMAHHGEQDTSPIFATPPAAPEHPSGPIATAEPAAQTVPAKPEPVPARGFVGWATLAWAVGAFIFLLPLIVGRIAVWRLRRRCEPIVGGPAFDLIAKVKAHLGLKRPVLLLQSRHRTMPMMWGILRPVLLLPAEAANWSAERLWVVLLHELGHVKRHDMLTKLLANLACVVYWFNPLVWLAFRRFQSEAERACDDLVLSAGSDPSDYAQHILEIASGLEARMFAVHGSIALARPSKLEGRLLAILDPRRNRRKLSLLLILLAALIGTAVVVPLSILRARDAATDKPADTESAGAKDAPATQLEEPAATLAPPATQAEDPLGHMAGSADIIAVVDLRGRADASDPGLQVKPVRMLKGPALASGLQGTDWRLAEAVFGELAKQTPKVNGRWVVFLRMESDGNAWPELLPLGGDGWFRPATPQLEKDIVARIPLPDAWGKAVDGVQMGLRARSAKVAPGQDVVVEVCLRNVGDKPVIVPQLRYNIYDYYPGLTFSLDEIVSPQRTWTSTLSKPGGSINEADCPYSRRLVPGEVYIHPVRLNEWSFAQPPIKAGGSFFDGNGRFSVRCHWAVDKNLVMAAEADKPLRWGVKIDSPLVPFEIAMPTTQPQGDCTRDEWGHKLLGAGLLDKDDAKPGLFATGSPTFTSIPSPSELYEWAVSGRAAPGDAMLVGRLPGLHPADARLELIHITRTGFELAIEFAYVPTWHGQPPAQGPLVKAAYIWGRLPTGLPPGRYHVTLIAREYRERNGRIEPLPKTDIRIFHQLECQFEVHDFEKEYAAFVDQARQAIRMPVQNRWPADGGDQRPTGLDFAAVVRATPPQAKDAADFPKDRLQFKEAVARLRTEQKLWALAMLLDRPEVDLKIAAAQALAQLHDDFAMNNDCAVPVLLAAAKQNHYYVNGRENARLHQVYRTTLKEGLEKQLVRPLTPKGLKEVDPGAVDFVAVEEWLTKAMAAANPAPPTTQGEEAWGDPVGGLQAGLAFRGYTEDRHPKARLLFRLCNAGKKPIRLLELSSQKRSWGESLPLDVRQNGIQCRYRGMVLEPPPPPSIQHYIMLDPGAIDTVEAEMDPANWQVDPAKETSLSFVFRCDGKGMAMDPGKLVELADLWSGTARCTITLPPRPKFKPPATQGEAVDLGCERVKIEAHGVDNLPGGLFAVGPVENKVLDALLLYQRRDEKKIGDGYTECVGRLPHQLHGIGDPAGDALEAVEYSRRGNRISLWLKLIHQPEGFGGVASNVYLRAPLPDLPPGQYEVTVSFEDYYRRNNGPPEPGKALASIRPLTCTFTVPPPAQPAPTATQSDQRDAGKLLPPGSGGGERVAKSERILVGRVLDIKWEAGKNVSYMGEPGRATVECLVPIRGVKAGQKVTVTVFHPRLVKHSDATLEMIIFGDNLADVRAGDRWLFFLGGFKGTGYENPDIPSETQVGALARIETGKEPIIGLTQQAARLAGLPEKERLAAITKLIDVGRLDDMVLGPYAVAELVALSKVDGQAAARALAHALRDATNTAGLRRNLPYQMGELIYQATFVQPGEKPDTATDLLARRLLLESAGSVQDGDTELAGGYASCVARLGMSPGVGVTDPKAVATAMKAIAARKDVADWLRGSGWGDRAMQLPTFERVIAALEQSAPATQGDKPAAKPVPAAAGSASQPDSTAPTTQPAGAVGPPLKGVSAKLAAEKAVWRADEVPVFRSEFRNDGPDNVRLPNHPSIVTLLIDGHVYEWPRAVDLSLELQKPARSTVFTITAKSDDWETAVAGKTVLLNMTPGKHSVQVRATAYEDVPGKDFRSIEVTSNAVEITVEPPAKPATPATQGEMSDDQAVERLAALLKEKAGSNADLVMDPPRREKISLWSLEPYADWPSTWLTVWSKKKAAASSEPDGPRTRTVIHLWVLDKGYAGKVRRPTPTTSPAYWPRPFTQWRGRMVLIDDQSDEYWPTARNDIVEALKATDAAAKPAATQPLVSPTPATQGERITLDQALVQANRMAKTVLATSQPDDLNWWTQKHRDSHTGRLVFRRLSPKDAIELEISFDDHGGSPQLRSDDRAIADLITRARQRGLLESAPPATQGADAGRVRGPEALQVSSVRMPQMREPSDSERLLATVRAAPARPLKDKEKALAIALMRPWVGRVVAPAYQPNWPEVDWKAVSDAGLGDVFIGDYRNGDATVHLVDTASVLLLEFTGPNVDLPAEGQEAVRWGAVVKEFCQHAEDIVRVSQLGVWRAPDAVYLTPHADHVAANDTAGWRNVLSFKLAKGYLSFCVIKLIDGEHPADSSFAIRTRLENYADVVGHLKRRELLTQIKTVNPHELYVLLRHCNVAEATTAELREAVLAREGLDPRAIPSYLVILQQRAPSAPATQGENTDPGVDDKLARVRSLAELQGEKATAELENFLKEKDSRIAYAAAVCLADRSNGAGRKILETALAGNLFRPNELPPAWRIPDWRCEAVRALTRLEPDSAVDRWLSYLDGLTGTYGDLRSERWASDCRWEGIPADLAVSELYRAADASKKTQPVIERLTERSRKRPRDFDTHYILAKFLRIAGQDAAGRDVIVQFIENTSSSPEEKLVRRLDFWWGRLAADGGPPRQDPADYRKLLTYDESQLKKLDGANKARQFFESWELESLPRFRERVKLRLAGLLKAEEALVIYKEILEANPRAEDLGGSLPSTLNRIFTELYPPKADEEWNTPYRRTVALYAEVVAKNPQDKRLKVIYAHAMLSAGMNAEASQLLQQLLRDEDKDIRADAARILGDFGRWQARRPADDAVPALQRALDDKEESVRLLASEAIRRIAKAHGGSTTQPSAKPAPAATRGAASQGDDNLDAFLAGATDRVERAELKLGSQHYTAAIKHTPHYNNVDPDITLVLFDADGKPVYRKAIAHPRGPDSDGFTLPATAPDLPAVMVYQWRWSGLRAQSVQFVMVGLGSGGPKELFLRGAAHSGMPGDEGEAADVWVQDIDRDGKSEVCRMDGRRGMLEAHRWTGTEWADVKPTEDRLRTVPLKLAVMHSYDAKSGLHLEVTLTNGSDASIKLSRDKRGMLLSASREQGLWVAPLTPDNEWGDAGKFLRLDQAIRPGESRKIDTLLNVSAVNQPKTLVLSGWASWGDKVEPFFRVITLDQPAPATQPAAKPGPAGSPATQGEGTATSALDHAGADDALRRTAVSIASERLDKTGIRKQFDLSDGKVSDFMVSLMNFPPRRGDDVVAGDVLRRLLELDDERTFEWLLAHQRQLSAAGRGCMVERLRSCDYREACAALASLLGDKAEVKNPRAEPPPVEYPAMRVCDYAYISLRHLVRMDKGLPKDLPTDLLDETAIEIRDEAIGRLGGWWRTESRRVLAAKPSVHRPATQPDAKPGPAGSPATQAEGVTRIDQELLLKELGVVPEGEVVTGDAGTDFTNKNRGRGDVSQVAVAVCGSPAEANAIFEHQLAMRQMGNPHLFDADTGFKVGDRSDIWPTWAMFVRDNVFVSVGWRETVNPKTLTRLDNLLAAKSNLAERGRFAEIPRLKGLPARIDLALEEKVVFPFVPAGLGTSKPRLSVSCPGGIEGRVSDGQVRLEAPGLMPEGQTMLPVDIFAAGEGLVFVKARIEVQLKPALTLTRDQRWRMLVEAMAADPPDLDKARAALTDVGNAQLEFTKGPLKDRPAEEGLPRGMHVLKSGDNGFVLEYGDAFNRVERGRPPDAWIALLADAKKAGFELDKYRYHTGRQVLAIAPTDEVRRERDRLLTEAVENIRTGLLALAERFPNLRKTAGKPLIELLPQGQPGRIDIQALRWASEVGGQNERVGEADRFGITVQIEPLRFPVRGEPNRFSWPWSDLELNDLALMGHVSYGAGDPELDAALRTVIGDALTPLQTLNRKAASQAPATRPEALTHPAAKPAPPASQLDKPIASDRFYDLPSSEMAAEMKKTQTRPDVTPEARALIERGASTIYQSKLLAERYFAASGEARRKLAGAPRASDARDVRYEIIKTLKLEPRMALPSDGGRVDAAWARKLFEGTYLGVFLVKPSDDRPLEQYIVVFGAADGKRKIDTVERDVTFDAAGYGQGLERDELVAWARSAFRGPRNDVLTLLPKADYAYLDADRFEGAVVDVSPGPRAAASQPSGSNWGGSLSLFFTQKASGFRVAEKFDVDIEVAGKAIRVTKAHRDAAFAKTMAEKVKVAEFVVKYLAEPGRRKAWLATDGLDRLQAAAIDFNAVNERDLALTFVERPRNPSLPIAGDTGKGTMYEGVFHGGEADERGKFKRWFFRVLYAEDDPDRPVTALQVCPSGPGE